MCMSNRRAKLTEFVQGQNKKLGVMQTGLVPCLFCIAVQDAVAVEPFVVTVFLNEFNDRTQPPGSAVSSCQGDAGPM
jgi:hypothetical protein